MKTTYWLLFAAMIARWIFIPMDLLAGAADWVWWTPVRALLILALFAEAFLRLAKQDRRFWITGGLVAAAQLLGLFEDVHLILSALTVALHYAGIICFCFFLKDIAPEGAKNRADNTAWAYVLGCILVICGLLFHVGLIALIGLLLLLVCDILLLRTVFRCARCYRHEYFEWKKRYSIYLAALAILAVGIQLFATKTYLGHFMKQTGVFPTDIVWKYDLTKYDKMLYVYEQDGDYIPFSVGRSSDNTMGGLPGHAVGSLENTRWEGEAWYWNTDLPGFRHGEAITVTISDLSWPLEEDYVKYDIDEEETYYGDTTLEGWNLGECWVLLLNRGNDAAGPQNSGFSLEIILQYFYDHAGITPPEDAFD